MDWITYGIWDLWAAPAALRAVAVAVCLWASMLTNGLEHGLIYGLDLGRWGLHEVDLFQEPAYYALAFLSGIPIVSAIGAGMAGRIFFQAPINEATAGGPLDEPPASDGTEFFGVHVPQLWIGRSRIAATAIGLALFLLPFAL